MHNKLCWHENLGQESSSTSLQKAGPTCVLTAAGLERGTNVLNARCVILLNSSFRTLSVIRKALCVKATASHYSFLCNGGGIQVTVFRTKRLSPPTL